MVAVDGHLPGHSGGRVTEPTDVALVPFAVVTTFQPRHRVALTDFTSFNGFTAQLVKHRRSDYLFFAVRLDGRFAEIPASRARARRARGWTRRPPIRPISRRRDPGAALDKAERAH
jgi:alpha-acetolactate decarboxylase